MRSEVLMDVRFLMLVFWVLPCDIGALKMEAACSSTTFVSAYKSTWHYNPEDQHQHILKWVSITSTDCCGRIT
jgi:hypothetical protein